MSQRDLAAELRGARVPAPDYVREQVQLIAATAAPRSRRFTWRRALVIAVPAAAAVAAAVIVTRPAHEPSAGRPLATQQRKELAPAFGAQTTSHGAARTATAPAPSPTRAQRYGASLSLQVPTASGVSNGVKRALRITSSLGGYAVSVHASSAAGGANANLTLRVPRSHVGEAISRLSALGTIVGEQVDVQDVQAGLNAGDRQIERLQRQLAALRRQEQTDAVKRQIGALTARIESLQRQRAALVRATRYATVTLQLATKPAAAPHRRGRGPLHGLGVAFRWIGIGAVYALALGGPLVLLAALVWLVVRVVRRRREAALLSRA